MYHFQDYLNRAKKESPEISWAIGAGDVASSKYACDAHTANALYEFAEQVNTIQFPLNKR